MKTTHIISDINNLTEDYEHLQWLRLFFINHGYHISEDWVYHSIQTDDQNIRRFKPAPNFDYMKGATEAIRNCDKVIFFFNRPSTFSLTMLRYALFIGKEVLVVCRTRTVLRKVDEDKKHLVTVMNLGTYKKRIKEYL